MNPAFRFLFTIRCLAFGTRNAALTVGNYSHNIRFEFKINWSLSSVCLGSLAVKWPVQISKMKSKNTWYLENMCRNRCLLDPSVTLSQLEFVCSCDLVRARSNQTYIEVDYSSLYTAQLYNVSASNILQTVGATDGGNVDFILCLQTLNSKNAHTHLPWIDFPHKPG